MKKERKASKRRNTPHDFKIDRDRLALICNLAHDAYRTRSGVFRKGFEAYLPQWNLPAELEHSPIREMPADPFQAARYLWFEVQFERLTRTAELMKKTRSLWENPEKNWVFDPRRILEQPPSFRKKTVTTLLGDEEIREPRGIEEISIRDMGFNLQARGENTPGEKLHSNAARLVELYDGDPRNIIAYNTVEQARENLRQFEGIGTGIANLFILYLLERKIASPVDPENILLKVDIHKGRIPINTGAVKPINHEIARDDHYVASMESAYRSVATRERIEMETLDPVLWIIGSELCVRKDHDYCALCPLEEECGGYTPENSRTGRYQVLTVDGKRIDLRKNKPQEDLFST